MVRGSQQYLEVDQTEVCLVVDMSHVHLLLKVRVGGLQIPLLGENLLLRNIFLRAELPE